VRHQNAKQTKRTPVGEEKKQPYKYFIRNVKGKAISLISQM